MAVRYMIHTFTFGLLSLSSRLREARGARCFEMECLQEGSQHRLAIISAASRTVDQADTAAIVAALSSNVAGVGGSVFSPAAHQPASSGSAVRPHCCSRDWTWAESILAPYSCAYCAKCPVQLERPPRKSSLH